MSPWRFTRRSWIGQIRWRRGKLINDAYSLLDSGTVGKECVRGRVGVVAQKNYVEVPIFWCCFLPYLDSWVSFFRDLIRGTERFADPEYYICYGGWYGNHTAGADSEWDYGRWMFAITSIMFFFF